MNKGSARESGEREREEKEGEGRESDGKGEEVRWKREKQGGMK